MLEKSGEPAQDCPTCHSARTIDPADIPVSMIGKIRKMFFGG
ncbi:MAG TPA: hypothetical protein VG097_08775 [Gemmata sp.]|nr:hypothetical protein [Gemmata sp.]